MGCSQREERYGKFHHHSTTHVARGERLSAYINTGLVELEKIVPEKADLHEEYPIELNLFALDEATDVVVSETLPEGASYLRSSPKAELVGRELIWSFDHMEEGDSEKLMIWVRPEREGKLTGFATVRAVPLGSLTTFVGRADLELSITGPDFIQLGEEGNFQIVVKNKGNTLAKDVEIVDKLPAGLEHASGVRALSFNVGDLEPNETKTFAVPVVGTVRDRVCNVAIASSPNAGRVSDKACANIVKSVLDVVQLGTKEQYLGKAAEYEIIVTNPGDTDLSDVVIVDEIPSAVQIIEAAHGVVTGNQAKWNLASLKAGEKHSFLLKLVSDEVGTFCNNIQVESAEGVRDTVKVCTVWKGHPALLVEVVDTDDPLLVGSTATYKIRIFNQGTGVDKNLRLSCTLSSELTPVDASGASQGVISDQRIVFAPYTDLSSKESIEYVITAKANEMGDARMRVSLSSETLRNPVIEEESTQVY
jgi:uncharacterized repeat protein (TIGR01451 family)